MDTLITTDDVHPQIALISTQGAEVFQIKRKLFQSKISPDLNSLLTVMVIIQQFNPTKKYCKNTSKIFGKLLSDRKSLIFFEKNQQ